MKDLDPFFHAKHIAIIGASREPGKVGHTILKQLHGRAFTLYPVNPHAENILGLKSYPRVQDIKAEIDLAVIATPAATVPAILDDCGKKNIKHVIIISAGFKETGNTELEHKLHDALVRNNILCIGPNCLGVYDAHTKLDTLFLPSERLQRPRAGSISFISQSGALGSAVLDLAAYENYGFAKFISYGNAANVDESDLLAYLANDPDTDIICLYLEGVQDGTKFISIAKLCKKPVIVLKGGVTEAGGKAAQSHTGSLAGTADVYYGVFKQANFIIAHTLEDVFKYMKFFEKIHVRVEGNRVQIITNGGGYGIVLADHVAQHGLTLATPGKHITSLKNKLPDAVILHNPIDVLGDATTERYELTLNAALKDPNNDSIIVVVLSQVPLLDTHIVDVVKAAYRTAHKPIVIVTTGSAYSEELKKKFEAAGLPCFTYPENAVKALAAYVNYCR